MMPKEANSAFELSACCSRQASDGFPIVSTRNKIWSGHSLPKTWELTMTFPLTKTALSARRLLNAGCQKFFSQQKALH